MEKIRFSCFEEFGWNIAICLPIVYGHFLEERISFTKSFIGSSPFFYFSPEHHEEDRAATKERDYKRCTKVKNFHPSEFDELWTPPPGKDDDKKDKKPKYDSGKAALDRLFAGEIPLLVEVNRKADILNVIALKERFGIDVVLTSAAEAWMVADELAAAEIPVVLNPLRNLPEDFDSLGATGAAAARLAKAGVKVAFLPPDTNNARLVPQSAGNAVAMGMPGEAAVDALTVNPAEIFGISDSYGTLEAGKDADVVVWDGDPLELMTSPDAVFIRGEEVPLVSRQTKLRDRYINIPRSPAYVK